MASDAVPNQLNAVIKTLDIAAKDARIAAAQQHDFSVTYAFWGIAHAAHNIREVALYLQGVERLIMEGFSAQVDINAQLVAAIAKLAPREMLTGPFDSEDAAVAFVENLAAHDPNVPHKLIVDVCDATCNLIGEWK